jgi:DNA-binding MarR family transcriptional regulator
MHRTVGELVDLGLLRTAVDPADGRARVVRRTRAGTSLVRRATTEHEGIEAELARRIGEARVAALRSALAADWGPPP